MIEVRDLIYDYPAQRALDRVSFTIRSGAVLALVGPNGAGKSTLLRCVAALDAPTEGQILVAGLDTREAPRGVHAALGYLPDFFGLYDDLSVERALVYAARSRGVTRQAAPPAAVKAAERVGLADRMQTRAGELSRGLRQRLAIGQTIVHSPRVLLLDEPAAGLDPEARRSLSDLIRDLAADGMTIVVSSHILAELEDYCTEMLMLRDGRIAGEGVIGPGEAAGSTDRTQVQVVFSDAPDDLAARLAALGLETVSVSADQAVIAVALDAEADTLAKLVEAGLRPRAFAPVRASLEQTYLAEALKASGPRP
jgi:ABC-2 type transport system ATP-binding protein